MFLANRLSHFSFFFFVTNTAQMRANEEKKETDDRAIFFLVATKKWPCRPVPRRNLALSCADKKMRGFFASARLLLVLPLLSGAICKGKMAGKMGEKPQGAFCMIPLGLFSREAHAGSGVAIKSARRLPLGSTKKGSLLFFCSFLALTFLPHCPFFCLIEKEKDLAKGS